MLRLTPSLGKPQVYLAFSFNSGVMKDGLGFHLDDVNLRVSYPPRRFLPLIFG